MRPIFDNKEHIPFFDKFQEKFAEVMVIFLVLPTLGISAAIWFSNLQNNNTKPPVEQKQSQEQVSVAFLDEKDVALKN